MILWLLATCVLLGGFQIVESQVDVSECVTDQFIEDLVGCFLIKYEDIIEWVRNRKASNSPYASDGDSPARHLLSTKQGSEPMDRRKYVTYMTDRNNKAQKTILNVLQTVKTMATTGNHDVDSLGEFKHVSIRALLKDYFRSVAHHTHVSNQDVVEAVHQLIVEIIPYVEKSMKENPFDPASRQKRIEDIVCTVFPDICNLVPVLVCLEAIPEAVWEDSLDWMQCLYTCEDLPVLSGCMVNLFTNTTDACREVSWVSNFLIRGLTDFLGLSTCYFQIYEPKDTTTAIQLDEGADFTMVAFRALQPPGAMCLDNNLLDSRLSLILDVISASFGLGEECVVQIQMSTTNYMYNMIPKGLVDIEILGLARPKCRSEGAIRQVVIGEHKWSPENFGIINVTLDNWMDTFRIPIVAAVDHHADGNIENAFFTLKLVTDGTVRNTTKLPLLVVDHDPPQAGEETQSVQCYSVNDPHINTFDYFYYNNFLRGYFYLYKHTKYPYQVQVLYQPCGTDNTVSCNCAVAVLSGDDVIVIDRCLRDKETSPLLEISVYVNGELTPGTRIFRMNGGLRNDIILPHGTIIRTESSRDMLNVWVTPSPYDLGQTEGLCGTYNSDSTDDLRLPNGTTYTGPGNHSRGQPTEFSQAWRVPESERIFQGAPAPQPVNGAAGLFMPKNVCHCNYVLMQGVDCRCGHGERVETCDLLPLYGEYTASNISSIIKPSLADPATPGTGLDGVTVDDDYVPQNYTWDDNYPINGTTAKKYCEDFLYNSVTNELVRQCTFEFRQTYRQAVYSCMEDIQMTDSTAWRVAALESLKFRCLNAYERDVRRTENEMLFFENSTCVEECAGNGVCVRGACDCSPGFTGPDCRDLSATPPSVSSGSTELCDSRIQGCTYATVMGHHFYATGDMGCRVQKVDVTSSGVSNKGDWTDAGIHVISPNQAACQLPGNGSYRVELSYQGNTVRSESRTKRSATLMEARDISFVFISVDTVCYTCDPVTQICNFKQGGGFCFINGYCYEHHDVNSEDECLFCDISTPNEWTPVQGAECDVHRADEAQMEEDRLTDRKIRISVSVSLSAFVIIVFIIAFCVTRSKEKKELETRKQQEIHNIESATPPTVQRSKGHDNDAMTTEDPPSTQFKHEAQMESTGHASWASDLAAVAADPEPGRSEDSASFGAHDQDGTHSTSSGDVVIKL